jgi:xylan 1,4-beta-xylosidase
MQSETLMPRKPRKPNLLASSRVIWRIVLIILGALAGLMGSSLGLLELWPQAQQPQSAIVHAPSHVEAFAGQGYIAVKWDSVPGAVSYRVLRADHSDGRYEPLNISQGPMARVQRRILGWLLPGLSFDDFARPPYTDISVKPGRTYSYRVAAWDGSLLGAASPPVTINASDKPADGVFIQVDASRDAGQLEHNWATLINSEHLSYMFKGDLNSHLKAAGEGLRQENKKLHNDLGIRYIRAHGILSDDLGVYSEDSGGNPIYNWTGVDKVYDMLLADGMKPFVELSFMPAALAASPNQTVFAYRAITSPPKSYAKWGALVREFARHLIDRYGREEVESWYFEVWNEPDLHMHLFGDFWHGSAEDYFRLYDFAADAIKSVDSHLKVGGPAAATPEFISRFLNHVATTADAGRRANRVPLDFLSYHAYSSPLVQWRPLLERLGFAEIPVFYTEWGVSARAGEAVNDLPYGAAWLVRVVMEGNDSADISAYWTGAEYSDEQKMPNSLFHGGFGLLGLDSIRKPRFWAYFLLRQLGTHRVALEGKGDGYGALIQGVATASQDGIVRVLLANVTFQQNKAQGDTRLDRHVSLVLKGLPREQRFRLRHYRVDNLHSNVTAAWQALGKPDWPDAAQLDELHRRDALEMLEPDREISADSAGQITVDFNLPMPALSMIELMPSRSRADDGVLTSTDE